MSAVGRFTIRSLRANRVRTIVTIAGVALAAALLTAVLTTYNSLTDFLYRTEASVSGEWMAMAQSDDRSELEQQVARAKESGQVSEAAMMQDVGFGELTQQQKQIHGTYLAIIDASGNYESTCAVRPSEGRLPKDRNEIMLFATWKNPGGLRIGDTLTIPVGQRMAVSAPEKATSDALASEDSSVETSPSIQDGTILDSSIGYLDSENDDGSFDEMLTDVHERTFTVVGFYDHMTYSASFGSGTAGFTTNDPQASGMTQAFVTLNGADTANQAKELAQEIFHSTDITMHTVLLRYMGLRGDSSIWDTFFGIAAVLSVVISITCISLIYNAFAISVAERTRQFGLLSSVGASKRQLRRAVLLEALLIAAIGIPIGLIVGIGGSAITFAIMGPSIATVIGGASDVPFRICVESWSLLIATALTLATVLISAFIPAWRAGRINTIDALRNTTTNRLAKKRAERSAKHADPTRLWKNRGISGRIFGIGGMISRINRKRGESKSATAAVSLALAIVLLMTAGSLNTFLGFLVDAVDSEVSYDVGIGAQIGNGSISIPEQAQSYSRIYDELCDVPNAEPVGWILSDYMAVTMPENMAGSSLRNMQDDDSATGGRLESGRYGAMMYVQFLDDATFDAFASSIGTDPTLFHDADHPRAIASKRAYGNNGSAYELSEMLSGPGTIELLSGGTYGNAEVIDYDAYRSRNAGSDRNSFDFTATIVEDGSKDSTSSDSDDANKADTYEHESIKQVPAKDVAVQATPLEIALLADEMPPIIGNSSAAHIVLPMSMSSNAAFDDMRTYIPSFEAGFDAADNDHESLAETLDNIAGERIDQLIDESGAKLDSYGGWFNINDHQRELDNNHMMATVVNVFCLLFTVILALIAMANVFNTLTNSLILRRREFAVMRSAGLSNRQFRCMIMDECANFGIKGLIPGMLISIAVSYLLFHMVTQSMSGLAFNLPWPYVGLAVAMTAAAMAISVAFGMHRCKADNVVEALRDPIA